MNKESSGATLKVDHPVWRFQGEIEAASDRFSKYVVNLVVRLIAEGCSGEDIKKAINRLPETIGE